MSGDVSVDFIIHTVPSSLLEAYMNYCEVGSDEDYKTKVKRPTLWKFVAMFHEDGRGQENRSAWNRYVVRVVWMRP